MVRTRTDATSLVRAGYVRINSVKITAHGHPVRLGDVVTLALDRSVRILKVEGFCEKRGDAPAARRLYLDLSKGNRALTGICHAPHTGIRRLAAYLSVR